MFSREYECPSCGAPVKQSQPGSKTLVCTYCSQTSHINADSLQAVGEKHPLIDYGSIFSIGATGRIGSLSDREFQVLGRVRIDYEDGFWDEWYITFLDDGSTAWIQEDDGGFTYFKHEGNVSRFPLDRVQVGTYNQIVSNWKPVFVTSKSKASINGGEGELPFKIIPGEKADFVDGILDGRIISVELLEDDTPLFVGYELDFDELQLSAAGY